MIFEFRLYALGGGVHGVGYVCNMHTAAINLNYGGGVNMRRWSDGTVQSTISLPSNGKPMTCINIGGYWCCSF